MAFRSVISSRIPMVIILGATGTGKTKLSVELAQKFGTEIISADSMQIYKGLDVVTAKASREEREAAPHHLIDILEPNQMFTVVDFRDRALKIIENLTAQGKIPIIVGGTNYYIESIVYNILVEKIHDTDALLWDKSRRKRDFDDNEEVTDHERKKLAIDKDHYEKEGSSSQTTPVADLKKLSKDKRKDDGNTEVVKQRLIEEGNEEVNREQLQKFVDNEKNYTNEEILAKLEAIDPVMAKRLHPNNRRKILRSIEYWLQTGRRHSEVLDEQNESEGQLRRPAATVLLWLRCQQDVHETRLEQRIDAMLEDGLIQELLDFHHNHNKQRIKDGQPPDYTKGIFQTLGFKEFHEYLMLSEEDRDSEEGRQLLQQSIYNMKLRTRRYARRQNKIVRARFLEHPRRQIPPIFELDTTDIDKWDEEVKNKAINIVESYLNETPGEHHPLESFIDDGKRSMKVNSKNYCEVCQKYIIGDREYAIHLNSNRHNKVLKKKNQLEAIKKKNDLSLKDQKNED